jgi:hypothetical protein
MGDSPELAGRVGRSRSHAILMHVSHGLLLAAFGCFVFLKARVGVERLSLVGAAGGLAEIGLLVVGCISRFWFFWGVVCFAVVACVVALAGISECNCLGNLYLSSQAKLVTMALVGLVSLVGASTLTSARR